MEETYPAFPKIPRLFRDIIVTEKIDGSNGLIHVSKDGVIRAGSRNRWLTPDKRGDNFGFAAWVQANAETLIQLGPGHHYGEWWGQGIQRGYGLTERRFSLFDTRRTELVNTPGLTVVPLLYSGVFDGLVINHCLNMLEWYGSRAADWPDPEGIIVRHVAGGHIYKVLLQNDSEPKGKL